MTKNIDGKYTIAVIEDEEVMSKSLVGELEDAGFAVITAADGEQGLRLTLGQQPDLILLDIVMPKMDGMTMMKKLRESGDYGKHVPIILLTNLNADDKIIGGVTQNEPSYYLVKSVYAVADVVERVRRALKEAIPLQ
jgi:DNA-binding response OmpR family regulator